MRGTQRRIKKMAKRSQPPNPPFLRVLNCEERAVPSFAGIQYSPRDQTRGHGRNGVGGEREQIRESGKRTCVRASVGRGEKSWGGWASWKERERSLFEFYATRFFPHPRGLGGRRRDGKNWNISLSAFSSPPQQKKQVGTSFRSQRRREGGLFKLFRSPPLIHQK